VLRAADTARAAADAAWRALSDAAARQHYDEEIGARRTGAGLDTPAAVPSGPGGEMFDWDMDADMILAAITDLLTVHPAPPRRVIVPELRGLFTRSCLRVTGDLGLHVDTVQLTAQPMAVEGLVVGQSPAPGSKVRRAGRVTVQVWHPPRLAAAARPH
jgi:PASTA domain